jgi:signal transduction histidine kinase
VQFPDLSSKSRSAPLRNLMKLPLKERMFLSTVVFALAVVLIALAVLQYHWSQQVSAATSARLHENLESSMQSFRDDLYREMTGIFSVLQANPGLPPHERAQQYAQEYQSWSSTATHSNLIGHLFLLQQTGDKEPQLLQLNPTSGRFDPVAWPADLDQLHGWLAERRGDVVRIAQATSHFRHRQDFPADRGGASPDHRGINLQMMAPAMIDLNNLALVRPVHHDFLRGQSDSSVPPQIDWVVVQLDRKAFQDHILPELAEHYFSGAQGLDYQVAVVGGPGSVLYTSDQGFGKQQDATPLDGSMPLFGPPRNGPPPRRMNAAEGPPPRHQHGAPRHDRNVFFFSGPIRLEPLHYASADSDWQLLVRHRQGSLEAVVTRLRHRNLALSFGVLLVLAAGIGIIVVSSQRARILARLQMDFVAAVSHELRTPLAVISSAAENIADGVVAGKKQLTEYGTEIKNQAKQLMQLVEQILLFAATRDQRHRYNMQSLKVAEVVDAALKDTSGLIQSAGFTVEQEIAPNLPLITGDLSALSHCLQNLITNAVKYGGDARWIRIRAQASGKDGTAKEVQVSVEDKGLGIGAAELQRIFEPFYRSSSATAAQIHGTGLGLPLAKDIAEAMGGRLTVSSEPGKGSCFTLHLPVAELAEAPVGAPATVNPDLSKS